MLCFCLIENTRAGKFLARSARIHCTTTFKFSIVFRFYTPTVGSEKLRLIFFGSLSSQTFHPYFKSVQSYLVLILLIILQNVYYLIFPLCAKGNGRQKNVQPSALI